jgi:hypothetical protein
MCFYDLARREEFSVPQAVAFKVSLRDFTQAPGTLAGAALDRVLFGGLVVTTYPAGLLEL